MPDPVGPSSSRPVIPEPEIELGVALGEVIAGKYRVERVIGKGGMGVVVAASQPELERTVAIKLIRRGSSDDPSATARLLREAKAAASIQSEHVARVLDVGTLDSGVPFIVMEHLEGNDLQTLLDRDGPLRAPDAVDFLLQACEAIAEAHRNGIVHRDLKPANLFIARLPGGRPCVKVVDFGISKAIGRATSEPLTQPASVVGSLYHMAPEQMRGGPVDARTDVWALGLLLYEMLTGRKPFGNQGWPEVAAQVLSDAAPLLPQPIEGASDELSAVIQKCLSRQPQQRYGTVAELAVALCPFGSRRAQLSLERIVLLATSTGSLSALALEPTEPVRDWVPVLGETRPVPAAGGLSRAAGAFAAVPATRSRPETPRATPATPFPVSTGPRAGAAPPSRGRLGRVALLGLALIGPVVVWAWQSARAPASEERAPLQPLAPAAPASAAGERLEHVERENPVGAEAPGGVGSSAPLLGAAGEAAGARPPRPAQDSQASVPERSSPDRNGASGTNGIPASRAPDANAAPPRQAPGSANVREPASPARAPAKPGKAPSPWDLHDIEFHDGAKP